MTSLRCTILHITNKPKGCFVSTDVLSLRRFCPHGRLVCRMFCPYGRFVSMDVLSLRAFCPTDVMSLAVLSPDVLSPDVLSLRTFCLRTFCLGTNCYICSYIIYNIMWKRTFDGFQRLVFTLRLYKKSTNWTYIYFQFSYLIDLCTLGERMFIYVLVSHVFLSVAQTNSD